MTYEVMNNEPSKKFLFKRRYLYVGIKYLERQFSSQSVNQKRQPEEFSIATIYGSTRINCEMGRGHLLQHG